MKKNAGLVLVTASLFFIFNPDIAIIDLIPDVFGYLLLIAGLESLAQLNDKISEARELFKKAAICSAAKLGLILVAFGLVTAKELPVSLLLFTFVMGLFDLIFLVPAYIKLFDGLAYLGERLDGEYLLSRRGRGRSKVERIKSLTLFFVVFKSILPMLPEFTSLLSYEYSNSLVDYYDFIGLYRTASIAAVFIPGVLWLVSSIRFYRGIMRDKAFILALNEKYEREVANNTEYFMRKYVNGVKILAVCAVCLGAHIYFDGYNILPSVVSAILFAALALALGRYTSKKKLVLLTSCLYGIASILTELSRIRFDSEYIPEQIMRNIDAYEAWIGLCVLSAAEAIAFVFVIFAVLSVAFEITKKYTGYFTRGYDSFDPEEASRELHSELLSPFIGVAVAAILSACANVAYTVAVAYNAGGVWIIALLLFAVYACLMAQNIQNIATHINFGYFANKE